MSFLAERNRQPELMDQPGLDPATHHHALDGLRTTNAISRTSQVIWRGIKELDETLNNGRPLRILDIASGGGDVVRGVAKLAAKYGADVEAHGCDINATAVQYAEDAASAAKLSGTRFFQFDALVDALPEEYDVLMSTLFFHHLTREDGKQLLTRMAKAARIGVLVDDLCRTRLGYFFAWAGGRLLTRSPIVHTDGPLSVSAAYTTSEFRQLTEEAGLTDVTIRRHWPQRFLMSWKKL